jgi:excisionase family DNA binding protein
MDSLPNIRTLTVDEIAKLTNIPERKVRRLVQSGYFPRIAMPGREVRVRESDVVRRIMQVDTSSDIYDNN